LFMQYVFAWYSNNNQSI